MRDESHPAAPAGASELSVPVDGRMVRARALGEGRAILLVHGLGTSAESWAHNLEALSACGRAYAIDLPGFGASDAPEQVLPPAALAEVLMRWCLAMGIQRATLIGHSLGGEVCLWFAARYPTMTDRLVVAGCTGAAPRLGVTRRLGRLLVDGLREPPGFMPVLLKAYWRAGPRRMLGTARRSDDERLQAILPAIQAPTLVVWGRRDPVVDRHEAARMVRLLPHGRLHVIEQAAHGVIFDAPERFNAAVRDFLCGDL
jgi:pimeloyl-ACP methyl ester carboxylesterase